MALLLPPDDAAAEAPDELLDLLDAVVLAGGSDLDPAAYGARPHEKTGITGRSATASSSGSPTARSSATCRCSASAAACSC